MKGCLKGLVVFLLLVVGAVGVLGFVGWRWVQKNLSANDTALPQNTILTVDSGTVTKNGQAAQSGETLKINDNIETGPSAMATVAFPNGSEMRLDENTQIIIKDQDSSINIYQELGRTWSRVMKLAGSNHSYEIETPTAVATVRGTAFSTVVYTESTDVDTDDGSVDVSDQTRSEKITVEADKGVTIKRGQRGRLVKRAIRQEIKNSTWFKNNRERDKKILQRLQQRGVKPSELVGLIKNVSPDDIAKIQRAISKARGGQLNLTEAQKRQLQPIAERLQASQGNLTPESAGDIAAALAIIFPEDFSDTAYWSAKLKVLIPLFSKFQLTRLPSTP